jgi:hypothetical protein
MNASRPEAETKYSRGRRVSRAVPEDPQRVWERRFERHRSAVLAAGILGATLLLVAEFTPLLHVHAAGHANPVRTITTGSDHSYAQIPIALLAAALAWSAWHSGSRFALLAVGVLGLLALGITIFADLPDAHSTGLVGSTRTGLASASSSPAIGLFLETGGGIVLILTAAAGMLLEPVPSLPRTPRGEANASRTRSAS